MMPSANPTGYFNAPEPPLEPADPVIIGYCSKCKGELYQDEPTVYEDGKRMCILGIPPRYCQRCGAKMDEEATDGD